MTSGRERRAHPRRPSCVCAGMRAALAALALLVAAPGAADTAVPEPPCPVEDVCALPASGPLALELQFMLSREHSCSQSWESTSDYGSLLVQIEGDGAATMTVQSTHSNVSGSQRGRSRGGEAPVRSRRETRLEWTGRATREPGAIRLSMRPRGASPVEAARQPSIDVECRPARVPVRRMEVEKGGLRAESVAETARVLLCTTSRPLLDGLALLVDEVKGVPLGRPGFGLSLHDMGFTSGSLHRYKRP